MDWRIAVLAGAAGGLVVEAVAFLSNLTEYRQARMEARATRENVLPHWNRFFDPLADSAAAGTRLLLGAVAAGLFHGQVTTLMAAVAVGAAAPALFGQIGAAKSVREVTELTEQKSG
ncbi:hypothetical protein [Nocardia arizonensis]|uniref:hypothetical protein n=1 Tax=Nocardia arizonensis TaxID=1141647 RepID=UPI0006D17F8C|nr:hypothetical protein [Nocardia arizonensis]